MQFKKKYKAFNSHLSPSLKACPLALYAFFIQTIKTPAPVSVHKTSPAGKKKETNLLNNRHFQGGNCWRAQTAQSLLGGKNRVTLNGKIPTTSLSALCVGDYNHSVPSTSPVPPYMKESPLWFYRDSTKLQQPTLKTHGLRKGPYILNPYLIVEKHSQFWPHGLRL